MTLHPLSSPPARRRASGIALVTALIFMLAMTVLGIAVFTSNTSEEKLSYAAGDYNRAFQAADSAISDGENWLDAQSGQPVAQQSCDMSCATANSVWATEPSEQVSNWFTFDWAHEARAYGYDYTASGASPRSGVALTRVGTAPSYVIEELGADRSSSITSGQGSHYNRWFYRITARGTGAQTDSSNNSKTQSSAVVQSVYARNF